MRNRHPVFDITFLMMLLLFVVGLPAQDFLEQITHNINGTTYQRLTSDVSEAEIDRKLFSAQGGAEWVHVRHIDGHTNHTFDFPVRIVTDPNWNRLIFGNYASEISHRYLKSYGDHAGETSFFRPNGITKTSWVYLSVDNFSTKIYSVRLYVADSGNNRVVELRLNMRISGSNYGGNDYTTNIEYLREFTGGGSFSYPTDVAYQAGGGSPPNIDNDFLWVTDTGNHRVVKISLVTGNIVESYGTWGGGEGNFIYPGHLAVAESDECLFIVDSGNDRLVKLDISQSPPGWEASQSYAGSHLAGIYADPYGTPWAADRANHAIARYDSDLNKLFSHGSYGLGQTANKMNDPRDIGGYAIFQIDGDNGNARSDIFTGLIFLTEKWSSGSGQTQYMAIPRYIENSFSYEPVFAPADPEDDGGIYTEQTGGKQSGDNPGEPLAETCCEDAYWIGTRFYFKLSDASRVNFAIVDYNNNSIFPVNANLLFLPGKNGFLWSGNDAINGGKYQGSYAKLVLEVTSVYNAAISHTYVLPFYPRGENYSGVTLEKTAGREEVVPKTFAVFPNYPNPFNNTTRIRYQIPASGRVNVAIYNVLGQKVKTLVKRRQEAGVYTVPWHGEVG